MIYTLKNLSHFKDGTHTETFTSYIEENPFEKPAFLEAIAGLLILGVLAFEILSADRNGSKIFLPADVPLLFAAPMKPQSVLLFRLMTQMGTAIVASLYLLFQLPNLILNLGLGLFSALGLIVAWILLIILGRLVQVLLYTVCSTHPEFKPWIRRILYAVLILFVVGMVWYLYSTGDIYISPYFAAKGGVLAQGICPHGSRRQSDRIPDFPRTVCGSHCDPGGGHLSRQGGLL